MVEIMYFVLWFGRGKFVNFVFLKIVIFFKKIYCVINMGSMVDYLVFI